MRTSGYYPNDSIIENGQVIKKSLGDLRRLAVTQTPGEKPSANTDVKNSNGEIIKQNQRKTEKIERVSLTEVKN